MKRLPLIFALLASCAWAQTTTTITGTIKDLTNAVVTSGKVTFTLTPSRDTTISGVARFTPTQVVCLINGSGAIKAQDGTSVCTLTMNTALQPTGSYYTVAVWPYNVKTSSFTFYAVLATYDWSTVVPTPATSPAQNYVDVFSNQSIGGNKTYSGTQVVNNTGTYVNPGVFTNTQVNETLVSKVNGLDPGAQYRAEQLQYATDAVGGGITAPGGTGAHQINGGNFEVLTQADSRTAGVPGTTANAVGVYGDCNIAAANAACWGSNVNVTDTPSAVAGALMIGNEIDMQAYGSPFRYQGLMITGAIRGLAAMPPAPAPGFSPSGATSRADAMEIALSPGTTPWPAGIVISRGTVNGPGVQLDGNCYTGTCNSIPLTLTGYTADVPKTAQVIADTFGSLHLVPQATAGVVLEGHLNQGAVGQVARTCTMAAGTTCTFSLVQAFGTSQVCIPAVQGTTAIAGACSVSGTTVTITAASANSQVWGAIFVGLPN